MWAYVYDHRGSLFSATKRNGVEVVQGVESYNYDAWGNLIRRTETGLNGTAVSDERFAVDGWDTAKMTPVGNEQFDTWAYVDANGNVLTRRLFGAGFDDVVAKLQGGVVSWYGTDRQGSVRTIFDNSGGIVASSDFDAWGNVTAGALTDRYGFTGLDWDGFTRLWMPANGRPYDSGSGRWLAGDEKGFDAGDVNLSRYVGNGPTNGVDPSGMEGVPIPRGMADPNAAGSLMGGYAASQALEAIKWRFQPKPQGYDSSPSSRPTTDEEMWKLMVAVEQERKARLLLGTYNSANVPDELGQEARQRREAADRVERQNRYDTTRALLKAAPPLTGSFSEGAGYAWSEWVGYFTRPLPKSPTSPVVQATPVLGNSIELGAALDEGMYSRAMVYGGLAVADATGLPSLYRAVGRGAAWTWSKAFGGSVAKQGSDDVAKAGVRELPNVAGGTRTGVETFWKRWTHPHPDQSAVLGQVGDTCGMGVVEMTLAKQGVKLTQSERQAFQQAFRKRFEASGRQGVLPEQVAELLQSAGVKVPPSVHPKVPYSVPMHEVETVLCGSSGAIVQLHRAEGFSHFVIVEKVISPTEAAKLGLPHRQGTLVQIVDSNEASRFYATLEELQLRMCRGGRYKHGTVIPLP